MFSPFFQSRRFHGPSLSRPIPALITLQLSSVCSRTSLLTAPLAEIIGKRGLNRASTDPLSWHLSFVIVGDRDEGLSVLHELSKIAKKDDISGVTLHGAAAIDAILETFGEKPRYLESSPQTLFMPPSDDS